MTHNVNTVDILEVAQFFTTWVIITSILSPSLQFVNESFLIFRTPQMYEVNDIFVLILMYMYLQQISKNLVVLYLQLWCLLPSNFISTQLWLLL